MAGTAPADALHAGTDEPNSVGRNAAEGVRHAGTLHTKDSACSSPSLSAHDEPVRDNDVDSVASSTGTAGRRRSKFKDTEFTAIAAAGHKTRSQQQQQQQQQQRLRKSASVSTTDTNASAQTNASTEVRAAVSNRASRAALNQRSKSVAPSPTIPQEPDHDFDTGPFSSSRYQDVGFAYQEHLGVVPSSEASPSASASSSGGRQSHKPEVAGIVQVTPAPPPSPPPQHRGRGAMASSFLPALFGRRRPTSSASSMTASSNFAANNPAPPGPQAFDFKAILNSLEADDAARADIDAIAEICGHSRLSLANAHANHRNPIGELVGAPSASNKYSESIVGSGLEPVRESPTPQRDDEMRLASASTGQASEERWQLGGSNEGNGNERALARQAARGVSGIAFGRSASTEEEGRARRHLTRVRDTSGERDQRRWR